jgi:mannose-6-phosphate isomerase-like protein (cupin superfamily)
MRRVVTGQGADGRSIVLSDGPAPQAMVLDRLGGASFETLWQLLTPPESPTAGSDPTGSFFQIRPGLVSFFRTTFPPDSRIDRSDMRAVYGEMQQKVPDLVPLLDPARGPGMHATDSLDLVVVVAGRVRLVLESAEVDLGPGDAVVQQGTWHAWRNPWEEPCVLAGVVIGASR